MKLYQEYLARHNLSDIHVAQHVDTGTLFFRGQNADGSANWKMFHMQYASDGNHPGVYQIRWMTPVHDGRGRSGLFQNIPQPDGSSVEWDQYEDYIYKFAKNQPEGMHVITEQIEITLCAWEMFVYAHDSDMARFANKESLFNSLDTDLSFVDRHYNYQQIIYDVEKNMANPYIAWHRDMMNYIRKYCHWLANMCDKNV